MKVFWREKCKTLVLIHSAAIARRWRDNKLEYKTELEFLTKKNDLRIVCFGARPAAFYYSTSKLSRGTRFGERWRFYMMALHRDQMGNKRKSSFLCNRRIDISYDSPVNPLNAEWNRIRHLLALVGARHIVHVSRIRVKSHPPFASIGRSSPYCPRQQGKG